jgi:hypothetical protein
MNAQRSNMDQTLPVKRHAPFPRSITDVWPFLGLLCEPASFFLFRNMTRKTPDEELAMEAPEAPSLCGG